MRLLTLLSLAVAVAGLPRRISPRSLDARGALDASRGGEATLSSRLASLETRGGAKVVASPPAPLNGAIARAITFAAAETLILYWVLTAAVDVGPKFERFAIVLTVYASSAIIELLLSQLASTVSAPLRQVLSPSTTPNQEWYEQLKKPTWNPPGWLFPIMWLLIAKPTQVAALFLLRGGKLSKAARLVYCLHLALGDTWNRVFFGEKKIGLGVVVIYSFVLALVGSAALFYKLDPTAGYLVLPTIGWVAVASSLNLAIYRLNQPTAPKR